MARANCNWWQYSRWIYNVGRTGRLFPFDGDERRAAEKFINGMIETRPQIMDLVCNRLGVFKGLEYASVEDWAAFLSAQPVHCISKTVVYIGRQLKVVPPTEEEKEMCDELIASTGDRYIRVLSMAEGEAGTGQGEQQEAEAEADPEREDADGQEEG